MQTNDQGPPSTAQEKPSEAAGGSLRELLDELRGFVRNSHSPNYLITRGQAAMLLDELDKQWTEILVLRAKLPKITHDEADAAITWVDNFVHLGDASRLKVLSAYIQQQRDEERRNR